LCWQLQVSNPNWRVAEDSDDCLSVIIPPRRTWGKLLILAVVLPFLIFHGSFLLIFGIILPIGVSEKIAVTIFISLLLSMVGSGELVWVLYLLSRGVTGREELHFQGETVRAGCRMFCWNRLDEIPLKNISWFGVKPAVRSQQRNSEDLLSWSWLCLQYQTADDPDAIKEVNFGLDLGEEEAEMIVDLVAKRFPELTKNQGERWLTPSVISVRQLDEA
ncbi:MAG: hypothetical protein N2C14_12215, partial [Planctomycetales bacterium]